ncbi:hypothetical protein BDR03DRAFT_959278 [Suillus americanus]|nr:hypothetical protein BDR03DRAFT_959278 [Suillus americanus]
MRRSCCYDRSGDRFFSRATQRFCGMLSATSFYVCVVHSALYGVHSVLHVLRFGGAMNVQLKPMEDGGVHERGGRLIPLVFCGTWVRPPSPTQEAASVDQSEWSSVQPVSVSVSSQVACKSALGMANNFKSSLPI